MIDFVIDDEGDYESSMTGSDRRQEILKNIKESDRPVSGSKLAKDYDVSRQVIVQDVALLRASKYPIFATNRGYVLLQDDIHHVTRVIRVKHNSHQIEEELNVIVDCGARVLDVTVEHEIYGIIRADLKVASRQEVKLFLKDLYENQTKPLTDLTNGIHSHTIEAKSEEILDLVEKTLKEKGFLYL